MKNDKFKIFGGQSRPPEKDSAWIFLPDGSRFTGIKAQSAAGMPQTGIVVDGFAQINQSTPLPNGLFELIRDPAAPDHFAFFNWQDGTSTILRQIEHEGRIFVPPPEGSDLVRKLTLPSNIQPPGDLTTDLTNAISKFIVLRAEDVLPLQAYIFASWFPDCFEFVPYLWIVGPLGSAKTKLLKLLSCFCRRALLVGDVRASAIYKLLNLNDPPSLLIDELDLDSSKSSSEILRLLRTGTTRDVPAVRNGELFSTYSFKIISSRQTPQDGALASRAITISMLPTDRESQPLDQSALRQLKDEFQPRLLSFRFAMRPAIEEFQGRHWDLSDMTPRMRQIARVLAAPFENDPERRSSLIAVLRERDEATRIDRSLEPEWSVAETLFATCHPGPFSLTPAPMLVGCLATVVNQRLQRQGEEGKLTARKVGAILRSLGLKTKRLGSFGRGLVFTQALIRRIHEVARNLGMDRKCITNEMALEAGNGGLPCAFCEEAGVTGGLRFVQYDAFRPKRLRSNPRVRLFDKPFDGGEESDLATDPRHARDPN